LFKWFFGWGGHLWPQLTGYVILALVTWNFLQADLAVTKTLAFGWIGFMLLRNLVLMVVVFGFYHVTLYILKLQGTVGKYHPQGQTRNSKRFLFNDQVKDNMFFSIVSGVPIWTAWEVLYLWLAGNALVPYLSFAEHPVWFVVQLLLIPLWRGTHFYFVHRLLHWKPIFPLFHSLHHKNPNPGPWSGMSMHPVEHLLYLSVVAIHFVIPSHPVHFFLDSQLTALTPAQGHTGFQPPIFKGLWPAGDYFHYLHHRFVSCNYGIGNIPWDKWLGGFYDGEGSFRTKKGKKAV
jgi:sterol desaturase/sphingolipid hydroxylase (fatty acid hydroxylase superfamily)